MSRGRRGAPPQRQQVLQEPLRLDSLKDHLHDVLVFPRRGAVQPPEYYRFPVVKQAEGAFDIGQFCDPPERWGLSDIGQRRVWSIAHPHELGADRATRRGPAFAAMPVKPEPGAASYVTCYLINVENIDNPNLWTVEEWNDGPLGPDFRTPQHPESFEVLLAFPWGRVFHLRLEDAELPDTIELTVKTAGGKPRVVGTLEQVKLQQETEVWSQLRSGTVAGRVRWKQRVVPLVNVTALEPGLANPCPVHAAQKKGGE